MSPSDIELLAHCYFIREPHPRQDTPAIREGIKRLEFLELIEPGKEVPKYYVTTEQGAAHITQLCDLPLPKQAWTDHNDQVIYLK